MQMRAVYAALRRTVSAVAAVVGNATMSATIREMPVVGRQGLVYLKRQWASG
jgi:hypothetical protein